MSSEPETKDPGPDRLRLFFAVWPGADSREDLQRRIACLRRQVQAAWVRPENLHLTLCFLGEVPRARLDTLIALNPLLPGPFEVCFDRLRFLGRRRMLWIEPSSPNPGLIGLVDGLAQQLHELGQTYDRRPFHAHVTLARKVRGDFDPDGRLEPIRWCIHTLDLVASDLGQTGTRYRRLCRWPLRTTPTGGSVE